MGSIMSQNSSPKIKGEDSSLIKIQEFPEDDLSRETEVSLRYNGKKCQSLFIDIRIDMKKLLN